METRWLYVTSEELEQLRDKTGGVCVIPYGAIEKHGLHLPLGTEIRDDGWWEDYPFNYAAERDPVDATETIGKALSRMAIENIANVFKVLKDDEDLLRWHNERLKGWE